MTKSDNSNYLVSKLFWKIFPVQFSLMAVSAINFLIDNLVISNGIGPEAVAAIALYSPVSCFLSGVSILLSVGSTITIVRQLGKTQKQEADNTYTVTLISIFVVCTIFTSLMLVFPKSIARLLGDKTGGSYLSEYIFGMGTLIVVSYINNLFMNNLSVIGKEKRALASILAMAVSNVLGDFLFVFVLKMGALGVGLATALSFIPQFLVLVPAFLKKDCILRPCFRNVDFSAIFSVIREGIPTALVNITLVIKAAVTNFSLAAAGGAMALASGSVQNIVSWFLNAILVGTGQAVLILVSLYASEKDTVSIRNVMKVSLQKAFFIFIVLLSAIVGFSDCIAGAFYKVASEPYEYTRISLRIFPFYVIPGVLFFILMNAHQGFGRNRLAMFMSSGEKILMSVCIAVMQNIFGILGVWEGMIMGEFLILLVIVFYAWIRNRRISAKSDNLIMLSEAVKIDEKHRFGKTIYNIEDVVVLSNAVCNFFRNMGLSRRLQMISGLAVEEMAALLFKYSLSGIKDAQIDARILHLGDEIVIRLRDNGRTMFDGNKIDFNDPEDPTANIGLKMLVSMAKEITANSIMGMNIITVTIKC